MTAAPAPWAHGRPETARFAGLSLDRAEALRYAGHAGQRMDGGLRARFDELADACERTLRPAGVWAVFPVAGGSGIGAPEAGRPDARVELAGCGLALPGADISRHLEGAREVALMACTLGAQSERELRKLGIAYKRARFFVTCNGSYAGQGTDFSREGLRAHLAATPKGGNHGRRADKAIPGQLSLFESVETPEKARIAPGAGTDGGGQLGMGAGGRLGAGPAGRQDGAASGRHVGGVDGGAEGAPADGAFGWQHALEHPEAACA